MKNYLVDEMLKIAYKIADFRKRHFTKMSWYHVRNADGTTYGIVKQVDTENWCWSRLVKLENCIWKMRDQIDPSCIPF